MYQVMSANMPHPSHHAISANGIDIAQLMMSVMSPFVLKVFLINATIARIPAAIAVIEVNISVMVI